MANDGILYGGKWYGRGEIRALSTIRSKSMVSEECGINTLTAEIYSEDVGQNPLLTVFGDIYAPAGYDAYVINGADIRQYTPFAPVELWEAGRLLGKYYLTSISRLARNWFKVEACSPIGILDQLMHKGGMYVTRTFSQICADIIGNAVTYSVDAKIASLPITGWLPYATARENLQQLLFAVGAAATYDASGNMVFKYNEPDVAVDIPDGRLYNDGSVSYLQKASKVTLIEHAFFQDASVEAEVLFDNAGGTSVNNALVVFDGPYHSLVGSGLTVTPVNCNCCYVTGTGTLTGKAYVHTQRELVEEDPALKAEENRVANATLVSSLNSLNTLRRVYNYRRNADEVSYGIVSDGSFKCGDLINFTDPFGDEQSGYVKEMTETISGITKSSTKIATNWKPKYLGNTFQNSMILKASDLSGGVWNVPSAMRGKPALVVLFGGFGGGQGGYNGQAGEYKEYNYPDFDGFGTYIPAAGRGGNEGVAGAYPNYIIGEYVSLAASYSVSFGAGGVGGAANGGAGGTGGHSVFGAYDTNNGEQLTGEYINLLDGSVVAGKGSIGFRGADGGTVAAYNSIGAVTEQMADDSWLWKRYTAKGSNGGAVGTYRGGNGVKSEYKSNSSNDSEYKDAGSGGGGAAYGANGGNAEGYYGAHGTMAPTHGGNGANAVAPSAAAIGRTGNGGNGGGGGGAGAIAFGYVSSASIYNLCFNHPGTGGQGSQGGKGSDGFALIYY